MRIPVDSVSGDFDRARRPARVPVRASIAIVLAASCATESPAGLLADPQPAGELQVEHTSDSPSPPDDAGDVSLRTTVRILFSQPIDPETLTSASVRLMDASGQAVPAFLQTDLTGGVVTLAPTLNLQPATEYRLEVAPSLRSAAGSPARRFSSRFTTTSEKSDPDPEFVFRAHKIDDRNSNCAITVGPDGCLYVADTYGEVKRYRLDPATGRPSSSDVAWHSEGDQIVGFAWDPDATAERLHLWISFARYGANYSGTISRLTLAPFGSGEAAEKRDYITGLPHDDLLHHQPNGIAFGPDGRLYQSIGGTATLGGNPNWGMEETPLSAAVIVADVNGADFAGDLQVNVRTAPPVSYDPRALGSPVKVYATGFRNAYDLCWHSSGHLFTATNQNSITSGVFTPASPDGRVPAIGATPLEMLYRVQPGKYYGHPNPSRGEYVLNGGNPTDAPDPFEVKEYPVGVLPHPAFDPALIYNLRPGGGNSANGMDEYRADGPLKGRLLIAYFSGAKGIQAFEINATGQITHEHPLVDPSGNTIRFRGAIDVAVHPHTGRVYVADFGDWKRPHHGLEGAVWMLEAVGAASEHRTTARR